MLSRKIDYSALSSINPSSLSQHRQQTAQALHFKPHPLLRDKTMPDGSSAAGQLSTVDIDQATKLRLFAESNGFHFFGNLTATSPDPDSPFAQAPQLGPWRMITYGFIARLDSGGWFEVGQLRVDTTRKLARNARRFTYIKADLGMVLPNFSLDAVNSALHPARDTAGTAYSTESAEFNRSFRLYTQPGQTTDVLRILTPDTMAVLIDDFAGIDIDIHGSKLLCILPYDDVTEPALIAQTFAATAALMKTLTPAKLAPVVDSPPASIEDYLTYYSYNHRPISTATTNKKVLIFTLIFIGLVTILTVGYSLAGS